MTRALEHGRLMRVSHSHVAATAREVGQENQILAQRLLQHPQTYSDWEYRHSRLMHKVCQPTRLRAQMIKMRATTLSLLHRRYVFEYLRDRKVTGALRHRYIALFYGARDYATAMVMEHGHYTRACVSASCSRFIGAQVLRDPAFAAPLTAYDELYGEYFRLFCDLQLMSEESASSACAQALLPDLRERTRVAREQLVRLR
ncbi:MAG TPA: hypothetical protein VGV09_02620 [Steroidobacteraceae bacterium]|nr:hypothetical protein [Steroidobacteraceae bacterium]